MFPPNLQKNIRELDRQISLLETECENMDVDKKHFVQGKTIARDSPGKPFLTSYAHSNCSHKSKMFDSCSMPIILKIDSTTVTKPQSDIRSTEDGGRREKAPIAGVAQQDPNQVPCRPSDRPKLFSPLEPSKQIVHKEVLITNPGETIEVTVTQKSNGGLRQEENERQIFNNISNGSIIKATESSDENAEESTHNSKVQSKVSGFNDATNRSEDRKAEEERYRTKKKEETKDTVSRHTSSDDDCSRYPNRLNRESPDWSPRETNWMRGLNEHSVSVDRVSVKKNWRPRSMRTRTKKTENEVVPMDGNFGKVLKEKEIQCVLRGEEKEKEDFLLNLNSSIKMLQFLTRELKRKSSQEKRNDVLNDMQNTLRKIDHAKWTSIVNGTPNAAKTFQLSGSLHREGEDNIIDLKGAFMAVKQFCKQLSDEKSFLSEELELRNRMIAGMRSKEKEYLTLISTLKFDLERAKEQAEEWEKAKKELFVCKTKLEEETKIIEGLKRSHGKMQDLVENYVLENDKLRTQIRIAKLESEKYNVLLASKEEEIKKYQSEMESFQRQICEQLNLLRSKASENRMDSAIKAITNHTSFLSQTEIESLRSEINDLSERLSQTSSKTSLASSWSHRTTEFAREEVLRAEKETAASVNDGGYTSCRSEDFESPAKTRTEEAIRNSKRVRSNTDQLLKKAKAKRFDKVGSASTKAFDGLQRKTCTSTSTEAS